MSKIRRRRLGVAISALLAAETDQGGRVLEMPIMVPSVAIIDAQERVAKMHHLVQQGVERFNWAAVQRRRRNGDPVASISVDAEFPEEFSAEFQCDGNVEREDVVEEAGVEERVGPFELLDDGADRRLDRSKARAS